MYDVTESTHVSINLNVDVQTFPERGQSWGLKYLAPSSVLEFLKIASSVPCDSPIKLEPLNATRNPINIAFANTVVSINRR